MTRHISRSYTTLISRSFTTKREYWKYCHNYSKIKNIQPNVYYEI